MNILFLSQVLPYPLDAGPKVRAYYTLRHLAGRGHAVTLLSFVRSTDSPDSIGHLQSFCRNVSTVPMERAAWRTALALGVSLLTGEPFLMTRDHVPGMYDRVRILARQGRYDVVHADQIWMAPYALAAYRSSTESASRPRLILDQHNAVYLIPRRMAAAAKNPLARLGYRRESVRMARYEAQACLEFDKVVTLTRQDQDRLLGLYANGRRPRFAGIIPICLDPKSIPIRSHTPRQAEILFVGGMHWPPNADGVEWFVRHVLPSIRAAVPVARFTAVGKLPSQPLHLNKIDGGLCLPGYVTDLQPYWERSSVFAVPLRAGGGMRVKILDAWVQGIPVVSSRIGAEGLACAHGENILLADTAAEFAQATVRLLSDPSLAERLRAGGRATIERHYDWRKTYPAWDLVYEG